MSQFDRPLSQTVASAMRPRPRPKDCYLNAFRAFPPATEILGGPPFYVEGLVGQPPVPHAWLETSDGRIIDATPVCLQADPPLPYLGRFRHTIQEVSAHLAGRGATLPMHRDAELLDAVADSLEGWGSADDQGRAVSELGRSGHCARGGRC